MDEITHSPSQQIVELFYKAGPSLYNCFDTCPPVCLNYLWILLDYKRCWFPPLVWIFCQQTEACPGSWYRECPQYYFVQRITLNTCTSNHDEILKGEGVVWLLKHLFPCLRPTEGSIRLNVATTEQYGQCNSIAMIRPRTIITLKRCDALSGTPVRAPCVKYYDVTSKNTANTIRNENVV